MQDALTEVVPVTYILAGVLVGMVMIIMFITEVVPVAYILAGVLVGVVIIIVVGVALFIYLRRRASGSGMPAQQLIMEN